MKKIRIFQVDAFADRLFKGNPAAVCLLEDWPDDELLQSISSENNLAETAFVVEHTGLYEIRWFTPTLEVDLCGHATLAAAYVLLEALARVKDEVVFQARTGEMLRVFLREGMLILDFPVSPYVPCDAMPGIVAGIGREPVETYSGRYFYMAVLEREEDISELSPDLNAVAGLDRTGLIVTAPGTQVDFVSRFFAPQSGIDEDPVTGSAHTLLIPYWSRRLEKKHLEAMQLSKRGGHLHCTDNGNRVFIGGRARLYLEGEVFLP
jgi:PhzF family phenazine biosynthesis protein